MADYPMLCANDIGTKTNSKMVVYENGSVSTRMITMRDLCSFNGSARFYSKYNVSSVSNYALYSSDNASATGLVRADTVEWLYTPYYVSVTTLGGTNPTSGFNALTNKTEIAKLLVGTTSIGKYGGEWTPSYHITATTSQTYKIYGTSNSWNLSPLRITSFTANTSTYVTMQNNSDLKTVLNNGGYINVSGCSYLTSIQFNGSTSHVYGTDAFANCLRLSSLRFGSTVSSTLFNYSFADLPNSGTIYINWNDPNGTGKFQLANGIYYGKKNGTYCVYTEGSTSPTTGLGMLFQGDGLNIGGKKAWTISNSGTQHTGGGGYYY